MDPLNIYRGRVTFVFEGDLFDVMLDLGHFVTIRQSVALQGLRIPDFRSASPQVKSRIRAAKDCAMEILLDRWVLVETFKEESHPQVWPARIYLDAKTDLPGTTVEVLGREMVDFEKYMKVLEKTGYDLQRIDLRHGKRVRKGGKAASGSV